MYKVRIKKACKGGATKMETGGTTHSNQKAAPAKSMGAIPKEDANIEVEKGETALGDLNGDSFLNLLAFDGKGAKWHSEGGMPASVPQGTFIFSNTKTLKIKDKELLKDVFNLNPKGKAGLTPAAISKNYQINEYIQVVKDPNATALAKRTAQVMVEKNLNKLGMLALTQESMKGFPDGIPAVAELAMQNMGIDPQEMMSQMGPSQPEQGESQHESNETPVGEMMEAQMGGMQNQLATILEKFQGGGDTYMPVRKTDEKLKKIYTGKIVNGKKEYTTVDKDGNHMGAGFELDITPPKKTVSKIKSHTANKTSKMPEHMVTSSVASTSLKPSPKVKPKPKLTYKDGDFYTKKHGVQGFGDEKTKQAFITAMNKVDDPKVKQAYSIFKDAWENPLSDGVSPAKIQKAITFLNEVDVPGSVGWLPHTDQDKMQDLAGILQERWDDVNSIYNKGVSKDNAGVERTDFEKYKRKLETSLSKTKDLVSRAEIESELKKVKDLLKFQVSGTGERVMMNPSSNPSNPTSTTVKQDYIFTDKLRAAGYDKNWQNQLLKGKVEDNIVEMNSGIKQDMRKMNAKLKEQGENFDPEQDAYLNAHPEKKAEYYKSLENSNFVPITELEVEDF